MSNANGETNHSCYYYDWGGEVGNPKRPSYPREYGARCAMYDKFFSRDKNGILSPNCSTCGNNKE